MISDIILGIILLISMFIGFKKGFTASLLNCLNWFFSVIIGFLFYDKLKNYLIINTPILDHLKTTTNAVLPTAFSLLNNTNKKNSADAIAEFLLAVISFLLIIIMIKLVSYLISLIFSKKHHSGILNFLDSLLGLGLGLIRGIIISLILLTFLVPVLNFLWPEVSELILNNFKESYFVGILYMDNPILAFIHL